MNANFVYVSTIICGMILPMNIVAYTTNHDGIETDDDAVSSSQNEGYNHSPTHESFYFDYHEDDNGAPVE